MDREQFESTLTMAHHVEYRVATKALEYGCHVEWDDVKESGRDLNVRVHKPIERVEIKDESNYFGTGNVVIERSQGDPKQPSGIGITTADVFLHVFGTDGPFVLYRVQQMKVFLQMNLYRWPAKLFSGSDNNNHGHLVKYAEFISQPWAELCNSWDELWMSRVWRRN